jgi:hypothetical protein
VSNYRAQDAVIFIDVPLVNLAEIDEGCLPSFECVLNCLFHNFKPLFDLNGRTSQKVISATLKNEKWLFMLVLCSFVEFCARRSLTN